MSLCGTSHQEPLNPAFDPQVYIYECLVDSVFFFQSTKDSNGHHKRTSVHMNEVKQC